MATSNEKIRDGVIRHQIGLMRYSGSLRNRLIKLLNNSDKDLRELLEKRLSKITERNTDIGPTTTKRLLALQKSLDALLNPTYKTIDKLLNDEYIELAQYEVNYMYNLIQNSLPVPVPIVLPTNRELEAIVTSRPMQGKILKDWVSDWQAGDRRRVMEQIQIGLVQNETTPQIVRRVLGTKRLAGSDGARGITRRGAQFLTRTITNSVANNAKQALYKANSDIVKNEQFLATLDSRTTLVCAKNDGKVFAVNTGAIPPLHGNCRSTRVPIIDGVVVARRAAISATRQQVKGLSDKKRRAAIRQATGQVAGDTNFEQFLRSQSREFIDDYLGKTKAKLFISGKMPLKSFVDVKGRTLTLAELRAKERQLFDSLGIE